MGLKNDIDVAEIAMLMKHSRLRKKKTTKATKTQGGDVRRSQIYVKSGFSQTKVFPPCGELKSKKATKVTETQGGDMHGGQIKVKSEFPVNNVASPHGELQTLLKKVASPQRRKLHVNEVVSPRGELQTPSQRRKRTPPLSSSSAKQSHKKIRTTSDVGVVGSGSPAPCHLNMSFVFMDTQGHTDPDMSLDFIFHCTNLP